MIGLVVFPMFIVASIAGEIVAGRRCLKRIDRWAIENRFEVVTAKRLWFSTGLWGFWSGGRTHRYFDVTTTDPSGAARAGTAKIYGGFGGILADEIDVRWST